VHRAAVGPRGALVRGELGAQLESAAGAGVVAGDFPAEARGLADGDIQHDPVVGIGQGLQVNIFEASV